MQLLLPFARRLPHIARTPPANSHMQLMMAVYNPNFRGLKDADEHITSDVILRTKTPNHKNLEHAAQTQACTLQISGLHVHPSSPQLVRRWKWLLQAALGPGKVSL